MFPSRPSSPHLRDTLTSKWLLRNQMQVEVEGSYCTAPYFTLCKRLKKSGLQFISPRLLLHNTSRYVKSSICFIVSLIRNIRALSDLQWHLHHQAVRPLSRRYETHHSIGARQVLLIINHDSIPHISPHLSSDSLTHCSSHTLSSN